MKEKTEINNAWRKKKDGGVLKFDFSSKIRLASTADKFTQSRFPSEVCPHIFTCSHIDTTGEHTLAPTHKHFLSSYHYIKQERLQRK